MKKFIALLLSLAMVLSLCSLTACGKRGGEGDTNKDGDTADAKYTLTIGHVYTEDSIEHKQMAKIKELVEEKTNGACQVKIFANEQLGDEQNIAEQCVTGACDMGFSEGSVWATVTNKPEFAVFGLPFQYHRQSARGSGRVHPPAQPHLERRRSCGDCKRRRYQRPPRRRSEARQTHEGKLRPGNAGAPGHQERARPQRDHEPVQDGPVKRRGKILR